jgi:hypothetical protein
LAGYTGTPLQRKLGLKPGYRIYILQPPNEYFKWISPLPEGVEVREQQHGEFDCIHLFVKDKKVFQREFVKSKSHLKKAGMLWVSWPKKSSNVATELDENSIREIGLQEGLVDVKVCAVDEIWSGLKFVFRVKDR